MMSLFLLVNLIGLKVNISAERLICVLLEECKLCTLKCVNDVRPISFFLLPFPVKVE